MAKNFLSDEQVEIEIERLKHSDSVRLARKYRRQQYQRRQLLYTLRNLEKLGKRLEDAGISFDILEDEDFEELEQ